MRGDEARAGGDVVVIQGIAGFGAGWMPPSGSTLYSLNNQERANLLECVSAPRYHARLWQLRTSMSLIGQRA